MKWYSVNKYIPHIGAEYFVSDSEFFYCAEYTGSAWICPINEIPIGDITHFCIPDPIEIEE